MIARLVPALLLAAGLGCGSAQAFYVEGLMSGMSSPTVEKILQKYGFEVTAIRDDGSIVASKKEAPDSGLVATFCDNRLVQVQNLFEPKFGRFVELVEKKRQELGPYASAKVSAAGAAARDKSSAVIFSWLDKETTVEVVFAEVDGIPQLSLFHRVKSPCR